MPGGLHTLCGAPLDYLVSPVWLKEDRVLKIFEDLYLMVAVSLHVGAGLGCLSLNIWANCKVDEKSKGLRDERRK